MLFRMDNAFDWNRMRAFLATAEHGSLSAAARHLGLTQPTLGRQISALEAELDLLLFERVGRGLELTQAGREMLRHVRTMGDAADRVALSAMGQSQSIEGEVRITASDILSAFVLPAVVKRLRSRAPGLRIDIVAANDIRDLTKREADIAIRHVRPEQPDLVARLIAQGEAHFYAAKSYIADRGAPQTKADLTNHEFVSFGEIAETVSYLNKLDIPVTEKNFNVKSDNGLVAWEIACAGLGISAMYAGFADSDARVVRILPQLPPITFPVWLTTHREIHTSPKIRLVFDTLAEALAA
jgi:DNA-binding transcriptional LysR family regulator